MKRVTVLLLVFLIVLSGCAYAPQVEQAPVSEAQTQEIEALQLENEALNRKLNEALQENTQESAVQQILTASLLSEALTVMQIIKDKDMIGLSTYVDPTIGLRFSPYSYVNVGTDLVFTNIQVAGLMTDPTVHTWGSFDGSGDPIQYTFSQYYDRFVYDKDYVSPHMIGNNTIIGTGNTLNNLTTVYPAASFVEFHFTGFDPQYTGMDWKSLRLIFKNIGGNWMLIGIEHDEWTI